MKIVEKYKKELKQILYMYNIRDKTQSNKAKDKKLMK